MPTPMVYAPTADNPFRFVKPKHAARAGKDLGPYAACSHRGEWPRPCPYGCNGFTPKHRANR